MAASALIGLLRGLTREVLSLAIWFAAILGAMSLGPLAAKLLALDSRAMSAVAGYVMVFVVIIVLGALVQRLVAKAVDATGLSGTDRVLGLVFGGARGLAICLVIFIILRPFVQENDWWQAAFAPLVLAALEDELLELLDRFGAAPSNPTVEAL